MIRADPPMKVEVCETIAPEDWDQQVCATGGNIHHSSIWASYVKAIQPQVIPQFISLVSPDGKTCGTALGFYECSRQLLLKPFSGRLWFDSIPVASEEKMLPKFLELLEKYARELGAVELSIDSYAQAGKRQEIAEAGFDLVPRLEFETRLDQSEDALWKALNPKRANKIRKALKIGVTICDLPAKQGIHELRHLQAESSRRIMARGGPDVAPDQNNCDDPLADLLASDYVRIVGAQLGDEIVSASLFSSFNGLVYAHMSGHNERGMRNQTGSLLFWEMMKRYRSEGARRFNLGGCQIDATNESSPEHGVYVYKKAFGGAVVECFSGRKTLRRATSTVVTALKSVFRGN